MRWRITVDDIWYSCSVIRTGRTRNWIDLVKLIQKQRNSSPGLVSLYNLSFNHYHCRCHTFLQAGFNSKCVGNFHKKQIVSLALNKTFKHPIFAANFMVLNDLSSRWSKFKFGTDNKNLDGNCRCKSTSNCNSCCDDMFLFCICSKVGFQIVPLFRPLIGWHAVIALSRQYKYENQPKSIYCWNYIWNIFNQDCYA